MERCGQCPVEAFSLAYWTFSLLNGGFERAFVGNIPSRRTRERQPGKARHASVIS